MVHQGKSMSESVQHLHLLAVQSLRGLLLTLTTDLPFTECPCVAPMVMEGWKPCIINQSHAFAHHAFNRLKRTSIWMTITYLRRRVHVLSFQVKAQQILPHIDTTADVKLDIHVPLGMEFTSGLLVWS